MQSVQSVQSVVQRERTVRVSVGGRRGTTGALLVPTLHPMEKDTWWYWHRWMGVLWLYW